VAFGKSEIKGNQEKVISDNFDELPLGHKG
jgi:hypothetical protein